MIMNPVDYSGIQTPGQSKDRKTFFFFLEETEMLEKSQQTTGT